MQLHCGAAKEVDDPAEFRQNLTQVTQVRLKVNCVPFLPIFGISLRLKREVQKLLYSNFTVVFSSVR